MHSDQFVGTLKPDTIDFDAYLRDTDHLEKVRLARDFLDPVMHVLSPAQYLDTDYPKLPFKDSWLDFRPGEVTVWAGFNGSGKSMLTGETLTRFAENGERICIASFEMKPEKTLARISKQVFGTSIPRRDQVVEFLDRTQGHIWLYDQQGTVKPDRMIAVVKHCAEKLKCKHILIDSLMKCVRGTDDYNGQKEFVDQLTAAARDYNVHIHLVAHLKKGDSDERMPNRYDISGAADISNLVDNVLIVWRNKRKERDIESGKVVEEGVPDAILICDKQRNGDWEGRVKLWYEKHTMRFFDFYKQRGIL